MSKKHKHKYVTMSKEPSGIYTYEVQVCFCGKRKLIAWITRG